MEKMKNVGERKTVLFTEGDIQPIVGGSSLQLEIKRAAEALAQRKPPGFVDSRAEGSVNNQLHAPTLVEEAFCNDCGLCGNGSQHGAPGDDVFDGLLGARLIEATLECEPIHCTGDIRRLLCFGIWRNTRDEGADFLTQVSDVCGEFIGA